jgi:hypothetical protein
MRSGEKRIWASHAVIQFRTLTSLLFLFTFGEALVITAPAGINQRQ